MRLMSTHGVASPAVAAGLPGCQCHHGHPLLPDEEAEHEPLSLACSSVNHKSEPRTDRGPDTRDCTVIVHMLPHIYLRSHRSGKMGRRGIHVTPRGKKWAVVSSGSLRAHRVVPTQKEAKEIALGQVKRSGGELYIHGRNGRIRERNTYGKDPYPPKR